MKQGFIVKSDDNDHTSSVPFANETMLKDSNLPKGTVNVLAENAIKEEDQEEKKNTATTNTNDSNNRGGAFKPWDF